MKSCRPVLRRGIVRIALLVLAFFPLRAAAGRLSNPFFVFEDGLGPQSVPLNSRLAVVKKLGFDGVELDGAQSFAQRLAAVDELGLKLFCLYVGVDVSGGHTTYEPGLEEAIRLLRGRDTLIWLTIGGGGPGADGRAVDAVRRVSDLAARSGLRVALYPHCGMYVARTEDALRIAGEAKRKNVGVTFNLCHWLMCDSGTNFRSILQQAMPHLLVVSINGADHRGNWDRLIQPLDRGDFDVEGFLQILIGLGYRGPIGLQCYQIPGDPETNLGRSTHAWRELSARVAASSPETKHPPNASLETHEAAAGNLQSGPASSALLAQGKAEFLARCGFCHAPDATGASGPDLTRSLLVRKDANGNLIAPVILNGRPDKGMPAFQFSQAQIASIVLFLHARATQELFSFGMPENYRFETGDATRGKAFFFGNGHCNTCHSPEDDLKGIASKYPPLTLMASIAYPQGTVDRTAEVITPSGATISGRLVHLDEFTVSIRDNAGWVHSWDRSAVKLEVRDPLAAHRRLLPRYTDAELHDLFAYLETLK